MFSSRKEIQRRWVKDKEENIAWETSINNSQYSHKLWRCNWVMLRKSLLIVANIFVNFRCNWINAVSWVIEKWDFVLQHSFLTHLMLIFWASMWFFYDTSEMKMKTKSKSKAKAKDEGQRYKINLSKATIKTMTSQ